MERNQISILIVNKNSSDFIELSLYALQHLTENPYQVFIFDTGSSKSDYVKLKKIVDRYDNVSLEKKKLNLSASLEHSTALDRLVRKVRTPYFAVLDADATFLIKGWDKQLIQQMDKNTPIIGTQAAPGKPQDFPLMFACLIRTQEFRKLRISFLPADQSLAQDTGWEMREKFLAAGFQGKLLKFKNTRNYKKGVFRDVICAEYYLDKEKQIFASHFGRGSTTGSAKYTRGWKKLIYLSPLLGKYLLRKKGENEKRNWLKIAKETIDREAIAPDKFETLKKCPYCSSTKIKYLLSAPDRLTRSPGMFHLSRCNKCNLVFQNPRIKEKYIGEFYTSELGYYQAPKTNKKPVSSLASWRQLIWKQVLIQYFDYISLGGKNILWKFLSLPFYKILKINLTPRFIPNGKLLEIGCSNGAKLEQLRDYGWQVEGVEMDKNIAKYAREQRKLKISSGRIEDMKFQNKSFDVIILSMVLEHLYDPFAKLKMIDRWMKPGGQLLFSIPWFEGFEFRTLGKYAYGLQLPTHITFLNKKVIIECLQKLGYKNIKLYHHFFDRDVVASAHFKYLDTGRWRYKFLAYNKVFRWIGIKPFVFLLSLAGRTSRVSIYAEKI